MKSVCGKACCGPTLKTEVLRRWPKLDAANGSSINGTAVCERDRKSGGAMLALQTIEPQGVNAVDVKGDWEEIKMAVDSGATETVMGETC